MSASVGEVARPTLRVRGLLGRAEPILITGGRAVADYREAFIGIGVAKRRNAIAIADAGRERFASSGRLTRRIRACSALSSGSGPSLIRSISALLRGRTNRLWSLSADPFVWPRMHRGRAVADSKEAWRSGEDKPPGCSLPMRS